MAVNSPVLKEAILGSAVGATSGFVLGTGVSWATTGNLSEALNEGAKGALSGLAIGAVSGLAIGAVSGSVTGYLDASKKGLNGFTGKSKVERKSNYTIESFKINYKDYSPDELVAVRHHTDQRGVNGIK